MSEIRRITFKDKTFITIIREGDNLRILDMREQSIANLAVNSLDGIWQEWLRRKARNRKAKEAAYTLPDPWDKWCEAKRVSGRRRRANGVVQVGFESRIAISSKTWVGWGRRAENFLRSRRHRRDTDKRKKWCDNKVTNHRTRCQLKAEKRLHRET